MTVETVGGTIGKIRQWLLNDTREPLVLPHYYGEHLVCEVRPNATSDGQPPSDRMSGIARGMAEETAQHQWFVERVKAALPRLDQLGDKVAALEENDRRRRQEIADVSSAGLATTIAHNERLVQLEKRLSEPTDGPEGPPEEETELTRALRAAERNGHDWVIIGDRYLLTAPKGCLDGAVVRSV